MTLQRAPSRSTPRRHNAIDSYKVDSGPTCSHSNPVRPCSADVCAGTLRHGGRHRERSQRDRKSTRLNSSHSQISYAVFCLKKKKNKTTIKHQILNKEQNTVHDNTLNYAISICI